jgi:hypothetical protein
MCCLRCVSSVEFPLRWILKVVRKRQGRTHFMNPAGGMYRQDCDLRQSNFDGLYCEGFLCVCVKYAAWSMLRLNKNSRLSSSSYSQLNAKIY